jgi:exopolysaccharide biosynthesis polyprenyl glycosylphosphotransferase
VYARSAGLNGLPTVALRVEAVDRARTAGKRLMDTFIAAGTLFVLSPLLLLVAALVKLTSPGPVFFRQERVGSDGRHFFMIKFRSMYAGAEARLKDLMDLNEGENVLFKIRIDPRVTPVGRFIRRWSIDELPQFFNVLRGEMSVVGPRPPLPREVRLYETSQLARLRGKPGITGLWQVSGRSDLTFARMVELDRHYLEHWSLGLDVRIMLRTVMAIVRRKGAY